MKPRRRVCQQCHFGRDQGHQLTRVVRMKMGASSWGLSRDLSVMSWCQSRELELGRQECLRLVLAAWETPGEPVVGKFVVAEPHVPAPEECARGVSWLARAPS